MSVHEILDGIQRLRRLVVGDARLDRYYLRPQKTILVRTVADGGESYYFCGPHRATLPALRRLVTP